MNTRRRWGCWLVALLVLTGLGAGSYLLVKHRPAAEEKKEAEAEPTAPVQVAALRRGKIERTVRAYGTVVAASGGTRNVAYPFECRVVAVGANIGQTVAAGDTLLQIEPSADARLALESARGAQQAADKALQDTQNRFKARLATNTDLAAAESAARDARLKLDSLQARLPDAGGLVKAPAAGVVTKLPAAPGTVVPSGGPLVEIAVENRFEARLGVAPAGAGEIKSGQAVHLAPVESRRGDPANTEELHGTVRVVGASIDPATRLVDVLVALDDSGAPVLIGSYLRAEIVVETKDALLAPRVAVQPEAEGGSGGTLFTIRDDKAVKHAVETGLDDGENVEITGGAETLPEGTEVVTVGAYELEDKMAVEIVKDGDKEDEDEKADDAKNDKKKAGEEKTDGKKDNGEDKAP